MKLAQLILPLFDNEQRELTLVHADLRALLGAHFGGYTYFPGYGAWHTEGKIIRDEVMVYMIAMERQRTIELRDLAAWIAGRARQKCVMIVNPNGDVEMVKPQNKLPQTA